jgi:hypothetical protein
MQFAPPFVVNLDNRLGRSEEHAKLVPCSVVEDDFLQFVDTPVTTHRAYLGPVRTPEEVAVLVTRSCWGVAKVTLLETKAVDGGPDPEPPGPNTDSEQRLRMSPGCGGTDEKHRLAVLPGNHTATLSTVSFEVGKKASRTDGRVQFLTEAGGLYSFRACRTNEGRALFWVRDERSIACVSSVCPTS